VKESEVKAKKLISDPGLEIFDDHETADYFEENLKTFDDQQPENNVRVLRTFDGVNFETSDKETFDGIHNHDVEKTKTFNGEIFENVKKVVKSYFPDTDEVEDLVEIKNQKIQENLLSEKFGEAKLEKPKKEKKSIGSKMRKSKTQKVLALVNEGKEDRKKALKCNICDYSCNEKSTMNRHIKSVHEGKTSFKCTMCDKLFFAKRKMFYHMESVHAFKCNICDYSCYGKCTMKRHIRSAHEGERPFKCKMCDKTFFAKSKMVCHMESVHEEKKAKSESHSATEEESDRASNKKLEKNARSKIRENYVNTTKSARN
jgi:KRAB domain-containing zinc finger protein